MSWSGVSSSGRMVSFTRCGKGPHQERTESVVDEVFIVAHSAAVLSHTAHSTAAGPFAPCCEASERGWTRAGRVRWGMGGRRGMGLAGRKTVPVPQGGACSE